LWAACAHSGPAFGDGIRAFGDGIRAFGDGIRAFGDGIRAFGDGIRAFAGGIRAFVTAIRGRPFAHSRPPFADGYSRIRGRHSQTAMTRYLVSPRTLSFIIDGDQVLLLRGAPTKRLWANRLNAVGGHVELGEDVYAAAVREMQEETGLEVKDVRLRGVVHVAPHPSQGTGDAGVGVILFVFTATPAGGTLHPSTEGALEWHPIAGVRAGAIPDMMADLQQLLPQALAAQTPFFAGMTHDAASRPHVHFSG
jgi:8-oxo-dGTP diphosphatase